MIKKVVFADIGGVLNHGLPSHEKDRHIDRVAVERLEKICRDTGASVVISSSWRRWMSLDRIRSMLRSNGLTAPIIGKTPALFGGRHFEVKQWLKEHPSVKSYVILDDNNPGFNGHFVCVDHSRGLRDENVRKAVRVLGHGRYKG